LVSRRQRAIDRSHIDRLLDDVAGAAVAVSGDKLTVRDVVARRLLLADML
jgi:hypothetical protein